MASPASEMMMAMKIIENPSSMREVNCSPYSATLAATPKGASSAEMTAPSMFTAMNELSNHGTNVGKRGRRGNKPLLKHHSGQQRRKGHDDELKRGNHQ